MGDLTKEELKKLLGEIEDEKKQEKEDKEKVDALMDKLVDKLVPAVVAATKEGKEDPKKPEQADPTKTDKLEGAERVKAFFQAVVDGDKVQAKALSEGTAGDGGYLVPDEFKADIVDWSHDKPVIRNYATVWPMKSDTLKLPALAADVQVYWGTENTSISTTSAEFTEVSLSTYKLNAIIYLSTELFEDSAIDLVPYLTDRFAQAIYREEDRKFVLGTGSGQPTGISQASLGSLAVSTKSADYFIDTYWRLPQAHRENAVWLMRSVTIASVSKLKDGDNNYILVRPTDGKLPMLMGRPVLEQNDCGSTIYFGDFRFYYIGDRRSLSVKTTTEGAGTFEKDQVAIKVTERVDGKCALTRAFRKITGWS